MQCRAIPYEGNEPYIFFSYSHKDADRVYPLLEQLVRDGYRVWYDDGNHAGDDWLENIASHLNNCTICLAMLSQNSEQSHNCKKEVSFAVQCKKKLMAVMLEKFSMTVGMRLQLSTIHYLQRTEYPSDKALLEKLYETELMKTCQAEPGSIPMRKIITEEKKEKPKTEPANSVSGYLKSEVVEHIPSSERQAKKPVAEVHTEVKEEVPAPKKKSVKVLKAVPKSGVKAEKHPEEQIVTQQTAQNTPAEEPANVEPEVVSVEPAREITMADPVVIDRSPKDEVTVQASQNEDAVLIRLSNGEMHIIQSALTRVGRSKKKCDFVISGNTSVSNHHANVLFYNDCYYVCDAGSSNGTFIKEERLEPKKQVLLENNSVFRICDEEMALVYGPDAMQCSHQKNRAFLYNHDTKCLRIFTEDGIYLDRAHKWDDGTLSNSKVSREHAQIVCEDGQFYLMDVGSRNGTFHNEKRIPKNEKIALTDRDQIRLVDSTLEFGLIKQ